MTRVRDFVVDLANGGHSHNEIMEELDRTFGPKAMSKPAIYKILHTINAGGDATNQRGMGAAFPVRTPEVIASVKAFIESDRHVTYVAIQEA